MRGNNSNIQKNRLSHLDLLRIIAIFLVVFNHTSDRGFMLFIDRMGSPQYFPYMMFSVFCKIAVPIFFMISGALLLPKQESYKQLFSKRILRMVVVLLFVSVPYYFWLHRANGFGISDFLTYIYSQCASTSLWYLYSYIGLLLLLPFLRSMVENMQPRDFRYLIIGQIILVGVVPCLEFFVWKGNVTINESFSSVIFVTQNIFYALIGFYIEHILDKSKYNKKTVLISILLSVAALVGTCVVTHFYAMATEDCNPTQWQAFFNCFIAVPAMTVYFLLKYACVNIKGQKTTKVLSVFGSAVFGVYLIEKIARLLTSVVYTLLMPYIGSFVASLVWCFAVCCLSFLIIIVLKNIPVIKKLVNKFI